MEANVQQWSDLNNIITLGDFMIGDLPGDSSIFPMVSKLQLDEDLDTIQQEIAYYHQYHDNLARQRRQLHQRNLELIRKRRQARVSSLHY